MADKIYIIAEQRDGVIRPESFELAGFGAQLAKAVGAGLTGIVLASPCQPLSKIFAAQTGIDTIGIDPSGLNDYNAEVWLKALGSELADRKPDYILFSHTATGWDIAPRLAVLLKASCSTAVFGFKPGPRFLRKICNGKIEQEVEPVAGTASVLTVMPGAAKPAPAGVPGKVSIIKVHAAQFATKNLGYVEAKRGALDLTKAEVIVSAGRGIGEQDKLELVKKLAECFDKGALGASRPIIDAGWLPLEHQVGQTGQTVHPKLYIACGISGAIQHTSGMSTSDLIVAINTDPQANIFNIAHIGIVQDLHELLPVLSEKICAKKIRL